MLCLLLICLFFIAHRIGPRRVATPNVVEHLSFFPPRNVIRNQGKWNGVKVSIKMLDRDTVPLTMQQKLEVKCMRDIRHQNLISFVGACCDSPNVCILMETAPKVGVCECVCEGCMYIVPS